jgi:hypothetical protein
MKSRSGHNRAICSGDRGRFGPDRESRASILARVSAWSTPFLQKFIRDAESGIWRQCATDALEARLLPKKKKVRKNQRSKAPRTSGQSVPEPMHASLNAGSMAALPTAIV